VKSNLAAAGPTIGYRLHPDEGFTWTGASELTVEELLAGETSEGDRSALEEATDFLVSALAAGPVSADELYRAAAREKISKPTLYRARAKLEVRSTRDRVGPGGQAFWQLPSVLLN
jgi:hypothetical protein